MIKLGSRQLTVLKSLQEHNGWHPGCGWIWSNRSTTLLIMHSLVKLDLATETRLNTFRISSKGIKHLRESFPLLQF